MKKILYSVLVLLLVSFSCNSTVDGSEAETPLKETTEGTTDGTAREPAPDPQDAGNDSGQDSGEKLSRKMTIGLLADPQYADVDDRGPRHYRSPLKKIPQCIATFNQENVDMVVCLGDIVDRNPAELDVVLPLLQKSKAPVYYVLGNHDFTHLKDIPAHMEKLGMPSRYYARECGGWRFLFLDTNDLASYSQMTPEKQAEFDAIKAEIVRQGTPNGENWNGGIGSVQMEWLKSQLAAATAAGQDVIVFAHHPLLPMTNHTVLNSGAVLELLSSFPCVRAYINGHYHPGDYAEYGNLPCYTLEAMLEGGETNSYAIMSLDKDSISFKGFGRVGSRRISFK